MPRKFVWDGDMADDCTCLVGNLIAHCECLGKRCGLEVWFVSVGPVDHRGMACGPDLFHSGEPSGIIIGGDMARAIAEAILLAAKP